MIKFGLVLPPAPAGGKQDTWLNDLDSCLALVKENVAELWVTDHFFWGADPTYEAWTFLTYLAARYPMFTVGPMVLGQTYRNPALLAKMAATLQSLSNGRFIMGIGAGWKEDEHRAYGFPYPEPKARLEQLEDTLNIMKLMWTEPGKSNYEGRQYSIKDAFCEPKPTPVPKIIVGGGGNKTMFLAAKYADGWNLHDAPFPTYRDRVTVLRQHLETLDRDPNSLELSWFGRIVLGKTEQEALLSGKGKWTRENAILGTPLQVVDIMQEYIDIGVRHFMLEVAGYPEQEVMNSVIEDVFHVINR